MNNLTEIEILEFINKKTVYKRETLSKAFNMKCEKITLTDGMIFIAKYYLKKNNEFNSIQSEINSLKFLSVKFSLLFPSILYSSENLLIMNFIEHNDIKNEDYQKNFANDILKIHGETNSNYGFSFDAQIGGICQTNDFDSNWVNFFREKRLNIIFEKINKKNSLPKEMNIKIEKIIKDLENRLPKSPKARLLHGDLWEGNILFHNGKLVGLIDPGIFFGHNELEIAYLTWFKFINYKFLDLYSDTINIEKDYFDYEPIYQLYYSLLNIFLWDREFYIKDSKNLLQKII